MSAVSPGRLGDLLLQVLAEAVVGHAALDLDPELGDVGELDRVVLARPDRLGEVLADLLGVDVEGGDELDVADVVAAEVDVHQARDLLGGVGVLVVLDALDEGVGAVADADDRDADLAVVDAVAVAAGAVVRDPFSVLMRAKSSSRRGGRLLLRRSSPSGYTSRARSQRACSSPRTCQTRWPDGERRQRRHRVDGRGQQLEVADPGALGEHQADREDAPPAPAGWRSRPCTRRPSASARARV